MLWQNWEKLSIYTLQELQYPHSSAYGELFPDGSPWKRLCQGKCAESLPPAQSLINLAVYGTYTKGQQKKLVLFDKQNDGWKHRTAFHKSFETNRHQPLKHLKQYCCYEIQSVIANRGGRWSFRNWGDIGLSPATKKTAQTKKQRKDKKLSSEKGGNFSNGSVSA